MAKYSIKEIVYLLEMHSTRSDEFNDVIMSLKVPVTTRILYFRLLAKSCDDSSGNVRWILKPKNGTTRTESVKAWIEDESFCGIGSGDLLRLFAPSSYRTALVGLIKSGLVHINVYNQMMVSYPVNGKMLSPIYAAKAIKSSYRKPISLDKTDDDEVESSTNSNKPIVNDDNGGVVDFDDNYWETDKEK